MAININGTGSITGLSSISSPTISGGNFPAGTAASPGITLSGDADTGLYSPGANQIAIATSGIAALTVDASQRVGLGTSTPQRLLTTQIGSNGAGLLLFRSSETASDYGGLEFGNHPSDITNYRKGAIYYVSDGTGFGRGSIYICNDSAGDANNVQPSDAKLIIDSAGRIGVGSTNFSSKLHVESTAANTLATFTNPGVATVYIGISGQSTNYYGADTQIFRSGNETERMRIDSSGRLLVGTSSVPSSVNSQIQFVVEQADNYTTAVLATNQNTSNGAYLTLQKSRSTTANGNTVVQNGDEFGTILFVGTDGALKRVGAQIAGYVDGTPGSGDMPGRLVFSTTADGASSPTQRMVIRQNGILGVNVNSPTFNYGDAVGFQVNTSGDGLFMRDGAPCLYLNRKTSDGDLLVFAQDGANEGTISVSGTTVSYNGAHLSRWTQLPGGAERTEILRGTVLSNIDEMCEWGDEENEQLNRMKVSDVEGDKNVSGVFQAWDDDDDTYTNDFYCAMTGDFIIRIGAGVTVERGDLLMSAGDGTAKPQGDGYVQDKTIAKVTSANVSCTYDDGSYCVPCVLMAC